VHMKDMKDNHNSRKPRALCFLLFFLALAVAGREAPECVTLSDDVSNDGTVAPRVEEVVPKVSSRRAIPQARYESTNRRSCSTANLYRFSFSPLCAPPKLAGQELLHFLTLQRK
jgi:hypothetical protein